MLTIVRHPCYPWLQHNRTHALTTAFDEAQHSVKDASANPETWLWQRARQHTLHHALEALPVECREVVVLRELEKVSHKEIAAMTKVPLGTVMSRLARARMQLQQCLAALAQGGPRCTVTKYKTCSTALSTMH